MFVNNNIAEKYSTFTSYKLDINIVRPCHRALTNEQPISLHNIKISSKTTLLKGYKSYRLVSTFLGSRHQAITVRPCHRALTMINIYHYINTLDEA